MMEGFDATQANEIHCVNLRPLAFRQLHEYFTSELAWEDVSQTMELEPDALLLRSTNEVFSATLLLKNKYTEIADVLAVFVKGLRTLYVFTWSL